MEPVSVNLVPKYSVIFTIYASLLPVITNFCPSGDHEAEYTYGTGSATSQLLFKSLMIVFRP